MTKHLLLIAFSLWAHRRNRCGAATEFVEHITALTKTRRGSAAFMN
jgi:hypothetical protein